MPKKTTVFFGINFYVQHHTVQGLQRILYMRFFTTPHPGGHPSGQRGTPGWQWETQQVPLREPPTKFSILRGPGVGVTSFFVDSSRLQYYFVDPAAGMTE